MADHHPAINIAGAVLFWSYILAALLFTSLALASLYRSFPRQPKDSAWHFKYSVFILSATLSFSILSYHMLNVLVLSHRQWAEQQSILVPTQLLGIFGSGSDALHLWQWSTQSTLFKDFGDALIATEARWAWSNASLAFTFVEVLFICIKCTSSIDTSRIYWTSPMKILL